MKRFLKAPTFLCVVALFTALLLKGGGAEAASMQSYGSHSIDAGVHPIKTLNAGVEVSARDIWAVGDSLSPSTGEQALIEHWDGAAWSIVPSPNPATTHNTFLNGVTEVAANDVWAVGGSGQTLIEHWNGKQWGIVSSPNPPGTTASLGAVAEVSAKDIWAVGNFRHSSTAGLPLIEHWNGEQWRIVASSNPAGSTITVLNGVTEVSARDVWAVGQSFSSSTGGLPLIEHWNGEQWRIVASPNPAGSRFTLLNGVTEVSANDVWVVGSTTNQPLIEHWNGKQWRIVASPNPSTTQGAFLNGVTEVSAHNVWAVGGYITSIGDVAFRQTLIEHWNGKQWRIVASPNPSTTHGAFLNGVTEVSARNIWAVGEFMNSSGDGLPLIEHWNGEQWRIVPSAD